MRAVTASDLEFVQALPRPELGALIPSEAGGWVLFRKGKNWYLRKGREADKLRLPAIEGEGAGAANPA